MAGSRPNSGLHALDAWRSALGLQIQACREWLDANDLGDAQTEFRTTQALARINDDFRVIVSIVADDNSTGSILATALAARQDGAKSGLFESRLVIENAPDKPVVRFTDDDNQENAGHVLVACISADPDIETGQATEWRARLADQPSACVAVIRRSGPQMPASGTTAAGINAGDQTAEQWAALLEMDAKRIFVVSTDEAGNHGVLETISFAAFQAALATLVRDERCRLVGNAVREEIFPLLSTSAARLDLRRRNVLEQLRELEYLRGKNKNMVDVMMQKVGAEKENLDREISSYQALRSIYSSHTNRLFTHLGMDALAEEWKLARDRMRSSMFTNGVRSAMTQFFRNVRRGMVESATHVAEISTLMTAMYRKFSEEHGSRLREPTPFTMNKYVKEIDRLEALYDRRFNTPMAMLTIGKRGLMHKFFETLASRVKQCYEYANREVDQWLRAIMAPMETELKEHQAQFMRRLESIKRIHRAISTLEERIAELLEVESGIRRQIEMLAGLTARLEHTLLEKPLPVAQAA